MAQFVPQLSRIGHGENNINNIHTNTHTPLCLSLGFQWARHVLARQIGADPVERYDTSPSTLTRSICHATVADIRTRTGEKSIYILMIYYTATLNCALITK